MRKGDEATFKRIQAVGDRQIGDGMHPPSNTVRNDYHDISIFGRAIAL